MIKLFCNACHNFIRNVEGKELKSLTGNEICSDCASHFNAIFQEVDKIAKRGIVRLERTRDDIKAKLEESLRSVIKE